jgi:hypothetical protein
LTGIGRFTVLYKPCRRDKSRMQYYIKFVKSNNLQRRLRIAKGTATEAELNQQKQKDEFITNKWEGIKKNMLETKGVDELKRVLTHYVDTSLDIKQI